jgi:ATP-dependent RNA helicase DDX19/DBP5
VRRAIVQKLKFVTLSHIQAESIPRILRGENLIAQAQGGSGKTVAFVIGMLAKINVAEPTLQAICLTNSRELANQIYHGAVLPLSQFMTGIRPEVMLKGDDDRRGRRSNAHLIVGTPGTVQSAIRQRPQAYIDASTVKIFVLDEADFMVSEPTIRLQTQEIRKHVPQTAQTLFFSATYTPEVLASSRKWVPNARIIRLKSNEELILEEIMQLWVNTSEVGKLKVLQDLYSTLSIQQSIIFVESKVDADKLTRAMKADKFTVSTLHSGIVGTNGFTTEQMRDEVMRQFRSGESKVLIATNALARGVDVPSVAVVVNYDLPVKRENNIDVPDPETYLHRICRTGRFGRSGTAINFIDNETDYNIMRAIETVFSPGKTMINQWDVHDIEGLAESHNARSEGVDVAAIDPVSASAKSTDSSNDSNGSGNVPPPASNGKADDTLVGK